MKRKFVVDSSVFLSYASYNKIYRLTDAVLTYGLLLYVNEELIAEIIRNAPKVIRAPGLSPADIISDIYNITILVNTENNFTGSEVIVTQEKALLGFTASPVAIHDLKWFKETYPVPL